jgi:hypothetical protein
LLWNAVLYFSKYHLPTDILFPHIDGEAEVNQFYVNKSVKSETVMGDAEGGEWDIRRPKGISTQIDEEVNFNY